MLELETIISEIKTFKEKIENESKIENLKKIAKELLSKNFFLSKYFKELNNISNIDKKKSYGNLLNREKKALKELLRKKIEVIDALKPNQRKNRLIDFFYQERPKTQLGTLHPVSNILYLLLKYHLDRGFTSRIGDEIIEARENFDLLNFKRTHIARLYNSSFYIKDDDKSMKHLLNTHATNFQNKTLRLNKDNDKIAAVSYSRCYRNDEMDATHLPSFHQFDGIKVSADANLMALKRHINGVASFLFKEKELKTRSRRTYFPFTEPSYELDIECKHKSQDKASQCQLCGGEKWIEWCGFGMINAEVFAKAGMSRDSIGYAFGIGIERSVMLVENQKDIRYMIFT